jgi:hypothetical protein
MVWKRHGWTAAWGIAVCLCGRLWLGLTFDRRGVREGNPLNFACLFAAVKYTPIRIYIYIYILKNSVSRCTLCVCVYRYCIVYSCDYYTCSVNRFYCARPVRFLSARRVARLRCAINVVVFNDIHTAAADLMSSNKRVSLTSVCVYMYIYNVFPASSDETARWSAAMTARARPESDGKVQRRYMRVWCCEERGNESIEEKRITARRRHKG